MGLRGRWIYRLRYPFFGLNHDSTIDHIQTVKNYILTEVFDCVYYGKISFSDAYNMPLYIRKWWIQQISKENEKRISQQKQEMEKQQRNNQQHNKR